MLLPSGRYLNMKEFIFETYQDGRPKDWISTINISQSLETTGENFQIQVNSPLRIDNLVIYQSGYRPASDPGEWESGLLITKDQGKIIILISFIFIVAGFLLTIYQKRKDL